MLRDLLGRLSVQEWEIIGNEWGADLNRRYREEGDVRTCPLQGSAREALAKRSRIVREALANVSKALAKRFVIQHVMLSCACANKRVELDIDMIWS
jgi:hypothetical protein